MESSYKTCTWTPKFSLILIPTILHNLILSKLEFPWRSGNSRDATFFFNLQYEDYAPMDDNSSWDSMKEDHHFVICLLEWKYIHIQITDLSMRDFLLYTGWWKNVLFCTADSSHFFAFWKDRNIQCLKGNCTEMQVKSATSEYSVIGWVTFSYSPECLLLAGGKCTFQRSLAIPMETCNLPWSSSPETDRLLLLTTEPIAIGFKIFQ